MRSRRRSWRAVPCPPPARRPASAAGPLATEPAPFASAQPVDEESLRLRRPDLRRAPVRSGRGANGVRGVRRLLRAVGRRLSRQRHPRSRGRSPAPGQVAAADRLGRADAGHGERRRRCVIGDRRDRVRLLASTATSASSSLTYLALLTLYSASLKHVVILDVLTIAGGFVLRALGRRGGGRRGVQPLAAAAHAAARAVPGAEQAPRRAGDAGRRTRAVIARAWPNTARTCSTR